MRALALALLPFLAVPTFAQAQSPLTKQESRHSVKETADRLAKALGDKGIKIAARIDHAAGSKSVGMEMPPTEVVMFGNPKLGTPLMLANPEIAIDLPMKVVIWQDKAGKVWIGYTPPDALKSRYAIAGNDEAFKAMSGALAAFTKEAAAAAK
jgi:uncharacterized protein (DUF302 family)